MNMADIPVNVAPDSEPSAILYDKFCLQFVPVVDTMDVKPAGVTDVGGDALSALSSSTMRSPAASVGATIVAAVLVADAVNDTVPVTGLPIYIAVNALCSHATVNAPALPSKSTVNVSYIASEIEEP